MKIKPLNEAVCPNFWLIRGPKFNFYTTPCRRVTFHRAVEDIPPACIVYGPSTCPGEAYQPAHSIRPLLETVDHLFHVDLTTEGQRSSAESHSLTSYSYSAGAHTCNSMLGLTCLLLAAPSTSLRTTAVIPHAECWSVIFPGSSSSFPSVWFAVKSNLETSTAWSVHVHAKHVICSRSTLSHFLVHVIIMLNVLIIHTERAEKIPAWVGEELFLKNMT